MRTHVFAFALTCGVAFASAPAAAQMINGHVGYQSPGFYPQPYYAPPVASSCCCPTVRRGFFSSWNFGCPTVAPYPQYAYPQYPQYPAYQPYPAMGYPQAPMYPAQPYPATYDPGYAPGVGVGVGIGPVGVGIGANIRHRHIRHRHVTHRHVTHRRVCWRDNRGRRHCR